MSKKTGMNGDMFKRIIEKKKETSSYETVSLCSPKAKNTVEMSMLYIKFCFVLLNCDFLLFQNKVHLFGLEKRQKLDKTKPKHCRYRH